MRYVFFMGVIIIMAGAMIAAAAPAFSATIIVPINQPTIQDAINVAVNGDTVLVKPGTYVENINFNGKAITVVSESGPDVTVIDGNQSGSVVRFSSGEDNDSVLDGFTITNGTGDFDGGQAKGGGIYCYLYSSPTIQNNTVTGNTAYYGGGIYAREYSSPKIVNNLITGNSADTGGGVRCHRSVAEIKNNTITLNSATTAGGGVLCRASSSPVIMQNTITDNSAIVGAGIYLLNDCSPTITKNTISNNKASDNGGGIFFLASCSPVIKDNIVSDNTSTRYTGGIGYGNQCAPVIKNNIISGNSVSQQGGGGIAIGDDSSGVISNNTITMNTAGWGGGIQCEVNASPVISNNQIYGNSSNNGAGIHCVVNSFPSIMNNTIFNNAAANEGGGIRCRDSICTIQNNIIYGNSAKIGAGVDCYEYADVTLINNTIYANSADPVDGQGGGISCRKSSSATMVNSILWDNSAPQGPEIYISGSLYPSSLSISYSDVDGGQASAIVKGGCILNWGPGMINANPEFVDPFLGDFHLYCTSPCCGAGDNTVPDLPAEDFEGDPRIAGGTVDMGADEFSTHFYWTGNATPGGGAELKFVGAPGTTQLALIIGFSVFDPPLPGAYGEWYIAPPMILIPGGLGPIPAEGVFVLPGTLPPSVPGPYTIYFQAMIGYQLTNLSVMEVE